MDCPFSKFNTFKLQLDSFCRGWHFNKEYTQKQPSEVFCKKDVFKNFAIFKGKHLWLDSLFNKVAGLKASNFIKKRLFSCEYREIAPVRTAASVHSKKHFLRKSCVICVKTPFIKRYPQCKFPTDVMPRNF